MRKQIYWLLSLLVVVGMALMPGMAMANSGPEETDGELPAAPADRWIVQLEAPALAQYTGGIAGMRATATSVTGASRLDVNTSAAQAYMAYLKTEQAQVAREVLKAAPDGTFIERDYQVVFNGFVVNLPEADETAAFWLRQLPGVKGVFRQKVYTPDMYASLPLINAETLWGQVGGQPEAGKGVKVAVIDSGIYITNTCFDPTGYIYPEGFPKMDTDKPAATSEKVIAARAYFRDDEPPREGDEGTWAGTHGSSHATHVGGTIACVADTVASIGTYTETISGVAPAAWLMSYRVFYPTADTGLSWSGSAFDPELIAAIEDAVADGADVVNNSWGEGSGSSYPDALDLAYDAAWDAGVVVVFSAGNSGPYPATTDHESDKNITVGASSTSGTIAAGVLDVSAPTPVTDTLKNMAYGTANFGEALEIGQVYQHNYLPGAVVDPVNVLGCNPWPAGSFTGKAALISRGTCNFSTKVYYAQEAGAEFVIVYNNAGDSLMTMGAGDFADQVTIPSIFVGQSHGEGMVAWYGLYTDQAEVTLDNTPYQSGNVPDRIANFSSRGASLLGTMSPDLVAPGVNIFSSGYGLEAGAAQHAGFGQASGTSMAAPHVSGSAALLKQLYPTWTPAQVKSALMSTAELDLLDYDGSEVGALDRGAGRIDLGHAGDPGVTFDKPSLSFGAMMAGQMMTGSIQMTDVFSHATPVTYTITVSETGNMTTTAFFDINVSADSLTFNAQGAMQQLDVVVDVAANAPAGDYEGLVWLSDGAHVAHVPVWIRVWPEKQDKVLLLDNDFSSAYGLRDVTPWYTHTLEALGIDYDHYDADAYIAGGSAIFPDLATLQQYRAVIWYTGDNWYYDGYFTVPTPPTAWDQNVMVSYLQGGGRLLATGQDLASVAASTVADDAPTGLYNYFLGADYVQDNVFSGTLSTASRQVAGLSFAQGITLDLSMGQTLVMYGQGAGNQGYVDEILVHGESSPDKRAVPATPIMQAKSGDHKADGYVALARSAEPTLEDPQKLTDSRTVYLSFGFEGINNPAAPTLVGVTPRDMFMRKLLKYLTVEPTAMLSDVGAYTSETATIVVEVDFVDPLGMGGSAVEYRWDFGDGSAFEVTTVPTATHVYTEAGTYPVTVEVMESCGHKALAEGMAYVKDFAFTTPTPSVLPTADTPIVIDFPEPMVTDTLAFTFTPSITFTTSWIYGRRALLMGPTGALIAHDPLTPDVLYTLTVGAAQTVNGGEVPAANFVFSFVPRKIYLPLVMKN
ncbi:MAG: S8 family serine peptidase [Anaerolineae bacterium]|nr:S8 family serine peptidase [Anaerolineae bacterium]